MSLYVIFFLKTEFKRKTCRKDSFWKQELFSVQEKQHKRKQWGEEQYAKHERARLPVYIASHV